MAKHLSAVPPDTKAPKSEPKNISDALSGSSRDVWVAMRKSLAKKLDNGEISSNAIASAYTKLQELDRLIRQADHDAAADQGPAGDVNDTFDASAI